MIKPDHPFLRENRQLHDLGLEKAQLNHFYRKQSGLFQYLSG